MANAIADTATVVLEFSDNMQALITKCDNGSYSVLLQHKYPTRWTDDNVLTTRMGFKTFDQAQEYAETVYGEKPL